MIVIMTYYLEPEGFRPSGGCPLGARGRSPRSGRRKPRGSRGWLQAWTSAERGPVLTSVIIGPPVAPPADCGGGTVGRGGGGTVGRGGGAVGRGGGGIGMLATLGGSTSIALGSSAAASFLSSSSVSEDLGRLCARLTDSDRVRSLGYLLGFWVPVSQCLSLENVRFRCGCTSQCDFPISCSMCFDWCSGRERSFVSRLGAVSEAESRRGSSNERERPRSTDGSC